MSPDQQHRCTVPLKADGAPDLAFEPSHGAVPSYSNSLFTLDLRPGIGLDEVMTISTPDGPHNTTELNVFHHRHPAAPSRGPWDHWKTACAAAPKACSGSPGPSPQASRRRIGRAPCASPLLRLTRSAELTAGEPNEEPV